MGKPTAKCDGKVYLLMSLFTAVASIVYVSSSILGSVVLGSAVLACQSFRTLIGHMRPHC